MNRQNQEHPDTLDGRLPRGHRQTLMEMNRPVHTARRDAAHARLVEIIDAEILPSSKEDRRALYQACVCLLEEAAMSCRRSQLRQDTPLVHYLDLQLNTLSACLALVKHELALLRESRTFAKTLDIAEVRKLQNAGDVFSESEMNILDCIEELLRFGKPLLEADTHARQQTFGEDDMRRYHLAYRQYDAYYRRIMTASASGTDRSSRGGQRPGDQ